MGLFINIYDLLFTSHFEEQDLEMRFCFPLKSFICDFVTTVLFCGDNLGSHYLERPVYPQKAIVHMFFSTALIKHRHMDT